MTKFFSSYQAKLGWLLALGLVVLPVAAGGKPNDARRTPSSQPFSTVVPPHATLQSPFDQENPSQSVFGPVDMDEEALPSRASHTKTTAVALGAVAIAWAAGLSGFTLWRRRTPGVSKLGILGSPPKPCDRAQLVAGAALILVVDLFLAIPAAYVIVAGGGVSPPAIAAEVLETVIVLPLNLVGLYLMGESGCVGMGQSVK